MKINEFKRRIDWAEVAWFIDNFGFYIFDKEELPYTKRMGAYKMIKRYTGRKIRTFEVGSKVVLILREDERVNYKNGGKKNNKPVLLILVEGEELVNPIITERGETYLEILGANGRVILTGKTREFQKAERKLLILLKQKRDKVPIKEILDKVGRYVSIA